MTEDPARFQKAPTKVTEIIEVPTRVRELTEVPTKVREKTKVLIG